MNYTLEYESYATYQYINGPARVYMWNSEVAIAISETLAARYDGLRKQGLHIVSDPTAPPQMVPEIIFYYLHKLPVPGVISEIIVQGFAPTSQRVGDLILGKVAAEALPSGRMVLPATLQEGQLKDALLYGWARLMMFTCEIEAHYYAHALKIEVDAFDVPKTMAIVGTYDDWALHMVNHFVQSNDVEFAKFISHSPLRAVFIAMAIERVLDNRTDAISNSMAKRIKIVADTALPLAQQELQSTLQKNATDVDHVQTVFRLMLVLNPAEHLTLLPLTKIDLSGEPHNNVLLRKLGAMPQIETLNLSDSMLSREGTEFLQNLVNLRILDLSNTGVMSSSIKPLRGSTRLEELNLSGTQVNDSVFATISQIKSLRKVNVTDTSLTPSSVLVLKSVVPDCEIIG